MSYINVVRINNAARYSNYPFLGEVTKYLDDFVFARVDNWDGHCAEALKISVLEAADQLLRSLGSPVPSEVAPGKDGSLSFVWCLEEKIVYCDVGPADALHAYAGNSETFWETVSRLMTRCLWVD